MEAMAVLERAGPDQAAVLEVETHDLARRPRGLPRQEEEELLRLATRGSPDKQERARLILTNDFLVIILLAAHRFVSLTRLDFSQAYEAGLAALQTEIEANQETSALMFAEKAVAAVRLAIVNLMLRGIA